MNVVLFPTGMTAALLAEVFSFSAPFRAGQVYRWISHDLATFAEMTDIPLSERDRLSGVFPSLYSSAVDRELTDPDGSLKLQIRLRDGAAIECVLLEDIEGRTTACLSCQVGCPMGCTFCKTGTLGFLRNLGVDEIMEQFHFLRKRCGTISNVVFMGMGEPLLNLEAVRGAIVLLNDSGGIGISRRKITISTCGVVPGILDLARNGPTVRLAVSLTSADEATRSALMPVNRKWNLASLKNALMTYQKSTGERITLEAVLIGNTNATPEAARDIVRWTIPLNVQINLIPWNKVPELPYTEPDRSQIDAFQRILDTAGLTSTRRMRRGRGIMGACGQLGDTLNAVARN